jgi:alkylation response protein AidB-like acyl-CoA dehydrogenase
MSDDLLSRLSSDGEGATTPLARRSWQTLLDSHLPALRTPRDRGGKGAGLLDALLVAECSGRHHVAAPLVEAIVTNRLLAFDRTPAASRGENGPVTLALQAASPAAEQVVPAAIMARAVIFAVGDAVWIHNLPRIVAPAPTGRATAASVVLDICNADRLNVGFAAFDAAREEWKLLNAARLIGASRRALEEAAAYGCERHAFGRPIGSFQGVAHALADAWTDLDGARLFLWKAVGSVAARHADAAAQISLAVWWAIRSAVAAVRSAMRAQGAYGMTEAGSARLGFPYITEWSLLAGDPAGELQSAADRLWGDSSGCNLPDAGSSSVTFEFNTEALAAADRARRFFARQLTPEIQSAIAESLDGHHPQMQQAMSLAGILYPDWPESSNTKGDAEAVAAVREIMADVRWPQGVIGVGDMVGKIVRKFGPQELRQQMLPAMAAGESWCCLAYSEPTCGSDLFAVQTTAVREEEGWRIDGEKMFVAHAHFADYALLVARTGERAHKHRNLTLFVVPLDRPGISLQPLRMMTGHRSNRLRFEAVRVSDHFRLGEVDGGTEVLATALSMEQGTNNFFAASLRGLLRDALAWATPAEANGPPPIQRAEVRRRLAAIAGLAHVADVLSRRAIWAAMHGKSHRSFGPMAKLFGSEAWARCARQLLDMTAPESIAPPPGPLQRIALEYRKAIPSTVYGGASEILRSLIAESALGLPRSR